MATKLLLFVTLVSFFVINEVSAYYCDSDKCTVEEYCCGDNICCTSYAIWQMWYIWCGLVLFVLLLSACAGFCIYRFYDTTSVASIILHHHHHHSNSPGTTGSAHGGAAYTRLEDGSNESSNMYSPLPSKYVDMNEKYSLDPPTYSPTSYSPPLYSPPGVDKDPNYKR